MKVFVAIALLAFYAVSDAYHVPHHNLEGPRFRIGKTHLYNVIIDVTSGIPGLRPQVARSVIKADLKIYAQTEKYHILKLEKVLVSKSDKASESKSAEVVFEDAKDLEDRLSVPIKFSYEDGKVTEYTLDHDETVESRKIKKSILRCLEMEISKSSMEHVIPGSDAHLPITWESIHDTPVGRQINNYIVTMSPDADFPYTENVFNVSMSSHFEGGRYPHYVNHHNFDAVGCAEVCKRETCSGETKYPVGCPYGYEPKHSPIKTTYVKHHNLKLEKDAMVPEIIEVEETHVADMYDQDMEVAIKTHWHRIMITSDKIDERSGQVTYRDLDDFDADINKEEIQQMCGYKSPRESVEVIKNLLKAVTNSIIQGDLEDSETKVLGERLILLQTALRKLEEADLKRITETEIERLGTLRQASDVKKVKRQIWFELLPLIGTEASVSFIVNYIREGVPHTIEVWEAKEMLEALPFNIYEPSEKILEIVHKLMEVREVTRHHVLHSAAHLTVAKVIRKLCSPVQAMQQEPEKENSWLRSYQQVFKSMTVQKASLLATCPEARVKQIVQEIDRKLKTTDEKPQIAVYIEMLSLIGTPEIIPIVSRYVYGIADEIQKYTPSYIDFLKTVAIYSLHQFVASYPRQVAEIVAPVYFNKTEAPKVRTAAFSVLIRSQPSEGLLQHVVLDTWNEPSKEVGSYVTSTLESYGNSTLPCMQPTAHRIKKVISQAKRFDIGLHHAQNVLKTFYDEISRISVEAKYEYTPSNESIIPSTIYGSSIFSTSSLKDVLFKYALNIQGLTQDQIMKFINLEILGTEHPKSIPPNVVSEIFPGVHLADRDPEMLRFTLYRRMFYTSSYNYIDIDTISKVMDPLFVHWQNYATRSRTQIEGHLVKVFIPSSYHSVSVARSLPYPVEFQMKSPLVFALKIQSVKSQSRISDFKFTIRPSVYYTKIYTNQIKNLRDCKEIGVYHELKASVSYPFGIQAKIEKLGKVRIVYNVPELPKKIMSYHSESGTYAEKKRLDMLPMMVEKEPIRTLPSQYKREWEWTVVGWPKIRAELHTEDIMEGTEPIPRSIDELMSLCVSKIHNAGWRKKSISIYADTDSVMWPANTEVTVDVDYTREHRGVEEPDVPTWRQEFSRDAHLQLKDSRWFDDLDVDDTLENPDDRKYIVEGQTLYRKFDVLPHIAHLLNVHMETKPVMNTADIRAEYNHTHGKFLHLVHADASIYAKNWDTPLNVSLDHGMAYISRPNDFQYKENFRPIHRAIHLTAFSMRNSRPFEDVDIVAKGVFKYTPVEEILQKELLSNVDRKYFLPETHEKCLNDMRIGKTISLPCARAIRERAIYNTYRVVVGWNKLPEQIRSIAHKIDIAFKHAYFTNLRVTTEDNEENKLKLQSIFIDKLTEVPVVDMDIWKPKETLKFHKMKADKIVPLSSIDEVHVTWMRKLTNNTYPPTCDLMEKYVRTYDQKTYRLPERGCSYVLTTHCTKYKQFAVIAKILPSNQKEIHMYIGENRLVLTPRSGSKFIVKYNGKEMPVKPFKPILLNRESKLYVFEHVTMKEGNHLKVHAEQIGIEARYDGKNLKIAVDPRYKGEMCGLCSEFDGEIFREYIGLERCLYSNPYDFAYNAAISTSECHATTPKNPYICPNNEVFREWKETLPTDEEDDEPTIIKRNLVMLRGQEVCFSIRPVPVCRGNQTPVRTREEEVEFHCLPKGDAATRQLVRDAKVRTLQELARKSVDFTEERNVAVSC